MFINTTCSFLSFDYNLKLTYNVTIAAYYFIVPLSLLFATFGHCLCFIAFYKESKTNKVYAFQFYDAVAQSISTLASILLLITNRWFSNSVLPGTLWFQKSYVLMWYVAYMAYPMLEISTTISLYISLAMTLDRAIGLGLPIKYRSINRKRWEILAVSISIFIGISTSLFTFSYSYLDQDPITLKYEVINRENIFESVLVGQILSNIRNVIWLIGLIALVASGFTVVYFYRIRRQKAATMTATQAGEKKLEAKKILLILTIYHSVQTANDIFFSIALTFLLFKPGFLMCERRLFVPLKDIVTTIVNASDFYVMMIVSEAFRKMISQAMPLKENKVTIHVAPA